VLSRISGMAGRHSLSGSPNCAPTVSGRRSGIGKLKHGVVAPHGVHDHGELSGHRGNGFLVAAAVSDLQAQALRLHHPL
jgi:hypothetical protein